MPSDTSLSRRSAERSGNAPPLRQIVDQAKNLIADPATPDNRVMRSAMFLIKQGFLQDAMVGLRRLHAANAYPKRVRRLSLVVGYLLRRGWGRGLGTVSAQGKD